MTDQEHADKLRSLVAALNMAGREAVKAGLTVRFEVDPLQPQEPGEPPYTDFIARVAMPL